jgi:hypothetical protein
MGSGDETLTRPLSPKACDFPHLLVPRQTDFFWLDMAGDKRCAVLYGGGTSITAQSAFVVARSWVTLRRAHHRKRLGWGLGSREIARWAVAHNAKVEFASRTSLPRASIGFTRRNEKQTEGNRLGWGAVKMTYGSFFTGEGTYPEQRFSRGSIGSAGG